MTGVKILITVQTLDQRDKILAALESAEQDGVLDFAFQVLAVFFSPAFKETWDAPFPLRNIQILITVRTLDQRDKILATLEAAEQDGVLDFAFQVWGDWIARYIERRADADASGDKVESRRDEIIWD